MNGRQIEVISHVRARSISAGLLNTRNLDLTAAILVALALPFLQHLPVGILRVSVGLVAVLFLPGYVFTECVFSKENALRLPERLAMSIGLSVSLIPIMTLLLSRVPGGITTRSISAALSIWVIMIASAAIWRRPTHDLHRRPESLIRSLRPGRNGAARYGLAAVAVSVAILTVLWLPSFGGVQIGVVSHSEPPAFYVLGSEGRADLYPDAVTVGDVVTVTVGIIHPLRDEGKYHVEVWLTDEEGEHAELAARLGPYTLATGSRMEVPIHWPMDRTGDDQKARLLLYDSDNESPMRELTLWIDVEGTD